jgi:hypothetical protein
MVKDFTNTINALRSVAVGRCRERLDLAAQKAKGLIQNGHSMNQNDKLPSCIEQYGVTSLMKRKHGL